MHGSDSVKTLQSVGKFESPDFENDSGAHPVFSYISYTEDGSDFDFYTRKTAYNGNDHYDWPILMQPAGSPNYLYLNFADTPDMKCTPLLASAVAQCVSIGKDGETAYYVKTVGNKATVYSIDNDLLSQCDSDSSNAWLAGGKYMFQKIGGGLRYYDGETWHDIGSGQYKLVDRAGDGSYYFVKSESGRKDLYKGVSVAAYPLSFGPTYLSAIYTASAAGNTPVRLASGRNYAGLVCQDSSDMRNLCILWPTNIFDIPRTDESDEGSEDPDESDRYRVYVCPVSFNDFPDGRSNPAEIVPLGDFLDEIIVCEGGYLHIARVSESKLLINMSGTSIVPITGTLPWTELSERFTDGICASAKLNGRRYVTSGTGLSSFTEGVSGIVMKILSPTMKSAGVDARSFYRTGQNTFLVATDKGVYRY